MSISYAHSATSPAEVAASVNRSIPLSMDTATLVDRMRRHYDDGCFACGRENPLGLHLDDFSLDEGLVSARFDPREEYRGAGTSLHGGVAATALDEMLVWAGILDLRVMSVTAKMEVKYRRPVQVTDPILVRARVDERRGRRLLTSGELLVDDRVCVEASGLYLITSDLAEMGIL
jgi:acyl-coenzyme A thioesterase PaaI-like protein